MSSMRFSPFTQNKNVILSSQQQPQPQQQNITASARQQLKAIKSNETLTPSYSDTDDDERDFFDEEDVSDISNSTENLSKEERYVLSHVRAEPQGQENLSGNITPVNEPQNINLFEKVSQTSPTKMRYSTNNNSNDFSSQNGSNRNSLILQQQQSHSNRNSLIKESQSNRSSLDVSQSSYNTLIIHENDNQSIFSAPINPNGINKHEFYINSSPSPPTYIMKKDKSSSRSRSFGNGSPFTSTTGEVMVPTGENEQYLNQSFVLKHLAKEVKIPKNSSNNSNSVGNNDSTRDSGVSENNSSNNNWLCSTYSNESGSASAMSTNSRNKSKSQPDLSVFIRNMDSNEASNSITTTLNFNDFEQLELENNKLRQQLNESLMKVAKSQKLEQEVTNIYRVHEELVQSCERRERLERTARTRLQADCRRLQELNRALREQAELLQNQLLTATTQQQQQLASGGRTQQDLLLQNKELVDANKRQYIEIQAQSATLEEQRIHINVLDNALKRLEEECRQKQIQVAQLQRALQINERREKLRLEFDNDLTKEINRVNVMGNVDQANNNLKWKDFPMRLDAECSKLDQQNLQAEADRINQEKLRFMDDSAQRKVSELQTRLKIVESRLVEKDAIIRALQGQKLYSEASSGSYSLLTNNDCYATTTPLIYNTSNYDNLIAQQPSSSASSSSNPNTSYDLLGATTSPSILDYTGQLYGHHQNYGQKSSNTASNLLGQVSSSGGVVNVGMSSSPNTSCSSSSTAILPSQQQQQLNSSSSTTTSNYFDQQSLDEQRKTIDDQLKQLDGQLLSKICCFPRPSLTGKKAIQPLLGDEMSVMTTNNSEAFLQNLVEQQRNKDRQHHTRENTPSSGINKEEMALLEKQGRCSQLRSSNAMGNLAQVSNMVKGQNTTDIRNISANTSKLPKIVLPPRKERNSSAPPPSALPRPPTRTLKPSTRKIEYGRLSETESTKSNETSSERNKNEYELKTSSLKRHQSPVSSSSGGTRSFLNMKNELQLALNGKGTTKNYGAIKSDNNSSPGITKIYYSNKPDYLSTKNYQRFDSSSTPPSPSSSDSMKRPFASSSTNSSGKKITFIRSGSAVQNQKASSRDSLNSVSSGSNSNSRSSPIRGVKMEPTILNHQVNRSRTRTPPKYLPLQQLDMTSTNTKVNYSPTKLPSSSVLHATHAQQSPSLPPKPNSSNHLRGRSGSNGENKYRIQF